MHGVEAQVVPYAHYEASKYGITATLTVEKPQYSEKEAVRFSAFITNNNSFAVTVWGGCQATSVPTFSILRVEDGRSVYQWKPTGLTCNYLYPVRINATQSYQLAAIGLGKNLTWDQRSGTPQSPAGFVDPGKYIIAATIEIVGFNPSETPCQPSGKDCDSSVEHSFNLQASGEFSIGSSNSVGLSSYSLLTTIVAGAVVATITIALLLWRQRRAGRQKKHGA
jgi:hypothetical protein